MAMDGVLAMDGILWRQSGHTRIYEKIRSLYIWFRIYAGHYFEDKNFVYSSRPWIHRFMATALSLHNPLSRPNKNGLNHFCLSGMKNKFYVLVSRLFSLNKITARLNTKPANYKNNNIK
jgi:hypothetical protein